MKRMTVSANGIVLGLAALALAAATPASAFTPPAPPTKAVDLPRYEGRWYEIARMPNGFEKGRECEAATADYIPDAKGQINVVQTCHRGAPDGPEKVYRASARILDPGTNAKFKLTFFLVLSKEYWVLDYAPDYHWAILADTSGKFLWLFSKSPTLPAGERDTLVERIHALGYDTGRLEFPAHK